MKPLAVERVYPDTSYWIAMRCRVDDNHAAWRAFHPRIEHARLLWSPWTHFEVLNTLRQLTLGSDSQLTETEARQLIASLEKDVQTGYYEVAVFDWREELRECRELSAQFGFNLIMRSGDVVQIAIARLAGADAFVTCDKDQHRLARAAGLLSWCIPPEPRRASPRAS